MLHSGKHGPVPTFLRLVRVIKLKMSQYLSWYGTFSQFKHLLCFVLLWRCRFYLFNFCFNVEVLCHSTISQFRLISNNYCLFVKSYFTLLCLGTLLLFQCAS